MNYIAIANHKMINDVPILSIGDPGNLASEHDTYLQGPFMAFELRGARHFDSLIIADNVDNGVRTKAPSPPFLIQSARLRTQNCTPVPRSFLLYSLLR